jgi:hypothetical protein
MLSVATLMKLKKNYLWTQDELPRKPLQSISYLVRLSPCSPLRTYELAWLQGRPEPEGKDIGQVQQLLIVN